MEKLVGMLGGQRVGRTDHQGYSLLYDVHIIYIYRYTQPSFVSIYIYTHVSLQISSFPRFLKRVFLLCL